MKENKTSHSVRHICIAAIKRKTCQPYDYKFTKFYETDFIENISFTSVSDFLFEENELPILSIHQSENNWWALTTHKIIGKINHKAITIPLNDIYEMNWGDFKGYRKEEITKVLVHLKDKTIEELFIETGKASMIPIYGFMNVVDDYIQPNHLLNFSKINKPII
jgi:hypothetical protein